jgi:uncharacterized protein GlcG (DUF336 family)
MALDYEHAHEAMHAALEKATEIGSPSSVAVVDQARELIAFGRQEQAPLASIKIAMEKAYTAVSMRMATKDLGALTQPGQPLYGIERTHEPALVSFAGGRLLESNGEVVGAVGVSGGTVEQDDEIATAGTAALAASA